MEGTADFLATIILVLVAVGAGAWIVCKLANGFIAAIDFMTRNE